MKTKIYLAPMSGITDLSFRLISRRFGAKLCFLEMLDAKAMTHNKPKNVRMITTVGKDKPLAAQLLGAEPDVMFEAASKLLDSVDISFLDINSACPAKKVIKKGAGAALLNTPARLGRIIKKLSSGLKVPVTVKLRTGFYKKDTEECVRTAKIVQANGASCVFIHGRTRTQGYSGEVDYESIKAVKNALKIPVFASGNIFSPALAKKMIDETGCDGILVARGALGNPWIFKDIENYLKDGKPPKNPGIAEKIKVLREHLDHIERYNEMKLNCKVGFMGKVSMWYLKGLPLATRIRDRIAKVKSYENLINIIDSLPL
jgi:nifR3 family TIM-barrel protein